MANAQPVKIGDISAIIVRLDGVKGGDLRDMADKARNRIGSGAYLVSANGPKVALLVAFTDDLIDRFHAGRIVGQMAQHIGGRGAESRIWRKQVAPIAMAFQQCSMPSKQSSRRVIIDDYPNRLSKYATLPDKTKYSLTFANLFWQDRQRLPLRNHRVNRIPLGLIRTTRQ